MNARDELQIHLTELGKTLKCATISYQPDFTGNTEIYHNLKINYTQKDLLSFLAALSFSYNDGYGTQHLYGTLWFTDGSHSERGEYDGSEWWSHKATPEIPEHLL